MIFIPDWYMLLLKFTLFKKKDTKTHKDIIGVIMDRTLGNNISDHLNELGMSQRDLAKAVGVNEVSMSRYVTGVRIPKAPVLARIAIALHTTSEELMDTSTPENDFETEYYRILRSISKNASQMTQRQKSALIAAIIEGDT